MTFEESIMQFIAILLALPGMVGLILTIAALRREFNRKLWNTGVVLLVVG